jgi:glycosyltransferase involved in cell wall biosynthesis
MRSSPPLAEGSPTARPAAAGVDVSVIVPARNEERLLGQCLRSLSRLEPFGGSLEVIVVDNGSIDRTREIAREWGARVLETSATTIAAVRNHGARAARGRVLAFLDADCTVAPTWLTRALSQLSSPRVVAVGSYALVPASGVSWVQEAWSFLVRNASSQAEVSWLSGQNLLVRALAFWQVNGFDASLETCEDTDLCYRLRDLGAIVYDASVQAVHYREPRTLRQFFRSEVWHGKNSYDGLRRGRLVWAELPSLLFPVTSFLAVLLLNAGLMLALAGRGWRCFWLGTAALSTVPVLYTARAVVTKGRARRAPAFLLLYLTYFLARATALILRVVDGRPRGGRRR